ncbi:PmoA family protein [Pirellulales bacterium]|nr:PmoA family protein [Pirellulales bacterium]
MKKTLSIAIWAVAAAGYLQTSAVAERHQFEFDAATDAYTRVLLDGQPIARFVRADREISRPYFSHVKTADGIPVTRRHPPDPKRDVDDHPTYHPGIWLAFGDLRGSDYWRLKAHVKYVDESLRLNHDKTAATMKSRFHYHDQEHPEQIVCEELLTCEFVPLDTGYLLLWHSQFSGQQPFWFGDQEEMGLGVRVATPIRAERRARDGVGPGAGRIVDAKGRTNGDEVWGESAPWCDYGGIADGKLVGVTLMSHPKNFRPCWFHARDYGLLVANPFGRAAFRKGEPSRVEIAAGDSFSLRFGIFVHSTDASDRPDFGQVYQHYLEFAATD